MLDRYCFSLQAFQSYALPEKKKKYSSRNPLRSSLQPVYYRELNLGILHGPWYDL